MRRGFVTLALVLAAACATAPAPGVLPTVEFPPTSDASSPYFAIFISGDGGWRKIDIKVSDVMRKAGMPVVGLLANRYFKRERTPDEAAADLNRLIEEYQTKWRRPQAVLIGYSRGAEVLPMMVNRLPPETRKSIAVVALLGPGLHTSLKLDEPDRYMLVPEVRQIEPLPLVCVYGTLEKESLCRVLGDQPATILPLKGGHHFAGDYDRVGRAILDALNGRG